VCPTSLSAAELTITINDASGLTLPWAVVSLSALDSQDTGSWTPAPAIMMQQGVQFVPFVLSASQGTEVSFPNLDEVRHHVYSFSRPKRFELRLYGRDETKKVVFDKAGPVALGCNIHDNMLSYVYVTEDPVHAVADSLGRATFTGLPAGSWQVRVWHPDMKDKELDPFQVTLDEHVKSESTTMIELRSVRRHQLKPGAGGYR